MQAELVNEIRQGLSTLTEQDIMLLRQHLIPEVLQVLTKLSPRLGGFLSKVVTAQPEMAMAPSGMPDGMAAENPMPGGIGSLPIGPQA